MDRFDLIEVTTSSIKSNLFMWSPLLSQTYPCGHLYKIKPVHVVTSIRSNLPMWSPLLNHMGRFDLIEVTTWTGLT
jgi:hypothetical protein